MNLLQPVVITGCQRSGTTLMSLILDSHADIVGIDEYAFRYPSVYSYLNTRYAASHIAFKLPQCAPLLSFMNGLPGLRIIWCVRDPRDVVFSMLKLKMDYNQQGKKISWAAHPMCAQAEALNGYWSLTDEAKRRLTPHMKDFQAIMDKDPLERSRRDQIHVGALCWVVKNNLPERYRQEDMDFRAFRYEDLVAQPEPVVRDLLDYLGVAWHDDVLRHHELHRGVSIGDTSNERRIDNRSVGQGNDHFSADELEVIDAVCGPTMQGWGYSS